MGRKTNAVRLVEQRGVAYSLREYDLDIEEFSAATVAELIGMDPAAVFKTLVATGERNGACFAVVAADAELNLKLLARAAEERRMEMVAVKEVEPLTGYRRGGVTAIGARKSLAVFLDSSATEHRTIAVSAGAKGLQLVLAPNDYIALTTATVTPIQRR